MNDQQRAAMQMALEALESVLCDPDGVCVIEGTDTDRHVCDDALNIIREALAQPQEPVAWQDPNSGEVCRAEWLAKHARECDQDRFCVPLYVAVVKDKK